MQKEGDLVNEKTFIENEIIPIARKKGLTFTSEDFLEYSEDQMRALSKEDLLNVSGGFSSKSAVEALLLTFLGSFAGVGATASGPPPSGIPAVVKQGD